MKLQDEQVLITGAAGFIGSHLTERLLAGGARVRAFVRYNSRGSCGWLDTLPPDRRDRIEFVAGDIRDPDAVCRAVESVRTVFHLCSLIGIPYSYVNPRHVMETNIMGGFNVIEACRRSGVGRVVHVSTSEVYGTAQTTSISESHPLCPQSPYAASKLAADKIAESYHKTFGANVVIARPFNCYGPRQSTRAVIPTIIAQCLAGTDIRLGRTDTIRDYTFVEDTVDGLIRLGESGDWTGMTINLGSGRGHRIADIVDLIAGIIGREGVKVTTEQERLRPDASEVERLVCDADRAKETIGWTAATTLEAGLEKTVQWFRDHPEDYRDAGYRI